MKKFALFSTVIVPTVITSINRKPLHLIMDIDDTLFTTTKTENDPHSVQIKNGNGKLYRFSARPKVIWSIDTCRRLGCLITIHTAATQHYADTALDAGVFSFSNFDIPKQRLYRHNCTEGTYGKDLNLSVEKFGSSSYIPILVDDQPRNQVGTQRFWKITSFGSVPPDQRKNDRQMVKLVAWVSSYKLFGETIANMFFLPKVY